MIELSQAYLQLATTGEKVPTINPLLAITTSQGNSVYKRDNAQYLPKIIPTTVGDMIWNILSKKEYMPSAWYWLHNLPLNHIALKTVTTNKKIGKRLYPRDGWAVFYTPHDLLLSRAGNTNGKEMGSKAFGGEINHHVVRQYLGDLVASGTILDEPRQLASTLSSG